MSRPGRVVLVFEPTPKHPKQRHIELSHHLLARKPELVCGRTDANSDITPDIPLFGEMTSRKHAVIKVDRDQDRVLICDLATPNGTWFGKEKRLDAQRYFIWEPGQTVRFGRSSRRQKEGDGDEAQDGQVDLVTLQRIQTPVASGGACAAAAPAAAPIGPRLPVAAAAGGANGHRVQTPRGPAAIGPQLPPHLANQSGSDGHALGPQRPAPKVDGRGEPPRGLKRPLEEQQACKGKAVKCDKCDQAHPTESCPHFKKARDNHKDAWVNYGRQSPLCLGRTSEKCTKHGRVVPQPGDGSCLFHSLCYGLLHASGRRADARNLRLELMNFISSHPTMEIAGDTLEEWIKWDTQKGVEAYTRQMRVSGWGGGIEMATCSIVHKINVHVYEGRRHGQFERISCFDAPKPTAKTIHVLYKGGMHFDALVLR